MSVVGSANAQSKVYARADRRKAKSPHLDSGARAHKHMANQHRLGSLGQMWIKPHHQNEWLAMTTFPAYRTREQIMNCNIGQYFVGRASRRPPEAVHSQKNMWIYEHFSGTYHKKKNPHPLPSTIGKLLRIHGDILPHMLPGLGWKLTFFAMARFQERQSWWPGSSGSGPSLPAAQRSPSQPGSKCQAQPKRSAWGFPLRNTTGKMMLLLQTERLESWSKPSTCTAWRLRLYGTKHKNIKNKQWTNWGWPVCVSEKSSLFQHVPTIGTPKRMFDIVWWFWGVLVCPRLEP